MDIRGSILEYCRNLGIDTVGFTKCRVFEELIPVYKLRKEKGLENSFEEKEIEKRVNPFFHFPEGKTIISFAFPYLFDVHYNLGSGFSIYTLGEDYHKVVTMYLSDVCKYIEGLGGKAKSFVDSNPLPERYIAYLCGIGFIGKNNMLITKKYGSYVFLGEVITDLEIATEDKSGAERNSKALLDFEECGSCTECLKACPTKSIKEKEKNPNICLSYITQCKDIEDKWFKVLGKRLFGCDSCQVTCPYNANVSFSNIMELLPKEHMINCDIPEILSMDKKVFEIKYKNTSCGWRGKNVLQRNALIFSHNNDTLKNQAVSTNSPYLRDYYNRLLSRDKL